MQSRGTNDPFDPFRERREGHGAMEGQVDGTPFTMVLGYGKLREVAADWETFSSDAPFRVPIPSEEGVRTVRQLPIETDPPEHTAYRALVSEPFSWQTAARIKADVEQIAGRLLAPGIESGEIEIVRAFALPLQSRALALMLGRPQAEAEEWISWGTHVFRDFEDGAAGHASELDAYLDRAIDQATQDPGDDFFGLLVKTRLEGRPLSRSEMLGFANLTFAGGRDTVINAITNAIHHLATHPDDLSRLRRDRNLLPTAVDEFLRYFSPITHIGRVIAKETELYGQKLDAESVVSLCFASANRDATAFDRADECLIDRRPNRHVAFGHGIHRCIGAPQAKTVLTVALDAFVSRVAVAGVLDARPKMEDLGPVQRQSGFDRLLVSLSPSS
jgi:cytochrome P450